MLSSSMLGRLFVSVFAVVVAVSAADNDDVCSLPQDKGRCRAMKPHFFFNAETNRCEVFFFGGCGGNGNNFKTLRECHDTCKNRLPDPTNVSVHLRGSHCLLPPISDPLRSCLAFFKRFTFNPTTLQCEPYIYGGCGATANLFLSKEECKLSCLFGETVPGGSRKPATSPAAFRAAPEGFARRMKAPAAGPVAEASPIPDEETNICNLPPMHPSPISCTGFMKKWTYDSKVGSCVEFIYGGCFGTKNLFSSKETCEERCATSAQVEKSKTPDVCALPILKGPCKALKFKFAYNKDTNRCEKFTYGGCQGNENRFDSLEECVNLCGGLEPQEKLDCSAVTCNKQDAAFHRAKGCQPILKDGECCPSSWDCSAWEERLQNPDKCFWANENHPRGKYFNKGERIPEASDASFCRMACVCTEGYGSGSEIICAMPGCYWPGGQSKGPNCKMLYKDLNSCCATSMKCDSELEELHTCTMDNTTFVAGQKMTPKDDPCKVCLCHEAWSGETDDKDYCYNIDCGLGYQSSEKLKKGCHPIYKEGVCCPVSWVCPEPESAQDPFAGVDEETTTEAAEKAACPPGVSERPVDNVTPAAAAVEPLGVSSVVETGPAPAPNPSDVCLLPKTLGPCEGYHEAWYFDIDSRKCNKFKTGGPGSGGNLFETEAECEETCEQFALERPFVDCKYSVGGDFDETAAMPLIMCLQEHKKFRFNKFLGKCEEFVDWSCGLKNNGYLSMDECEAKCMSHEHTDEEVEEVFKGKEDKCNLPTKTGPCKSRLSRFFYDTHTGKCKLFYYGGCQGNANNFQDERDCIETCVSDEHLSRAIHPQDLDVHSPCKQKGAVSGPCRAHRPRFYFDDEKKICRIFFFGGCGGNDNNFASLKECAATCPVDEAAQSNHLQICELPRQTGNCHVSEKRFFYNKDTNVCEKFEYTGCGGSGGDEGNFRTHADCQLECVLPRTMKHLENEAHQPAIEARSTSQDGVDSNGDSSSEDACLQDQFIGMCRAAIRRFYFDRNAKECKKFIYGGCGGNDNNFASLAECESKCSRHLPKERTRLKAEKSKFLSKNLPKNPLCLLPVEVGPCEAFIPSYFFNTQTKRCESFIYGGCRGNGNRFASKEDCESACPMPSQLAPEIISLPAATAKCYLGDQKFNIGDMLRYSNNRCRSCQCLTPPGLTCIEKTCKAVKLSQTGNSICEPTYDKEGCCIVGYKCKAKSGQPEDCANRICAVFDFRAPPGQTCTSLSDDCCQAGIMCVEN